MCKVGVVLGGGLGNQLFQIFTIISYNIDNKCKDYIHNKLFIKSNIRNYYWDTLFSNICYDYLNNYDIYIESSFCYNNIPIFNNDTLLNGNFQSHKYFEHNINKIKEIIGIDEKINNVLIKYPEYTINKTISVHYRMGDYLYIPTTHPVKKPGYYINSFKSLIDKGVDIYDYDILYFCEENDNKRVDDYNLEINNALKKITGKDLRYKKVSDNIPDWEQLLIMTSAKHYIIGNSTFSWFGAYLSLSKDAIICCPETWFGPALDFITDDLFKDNWIKNGDDFI
jgi:hypothetical protein